MHSSVPNPDAAFEGATSRGEEFPASPTYYDRPLLKAPHWEWNVITYLFLGGIMGGLGIIAAIADPKKEDERRMRRSARYATFVLANANPAVLISHLGRPERFYNMMRVVKLKSPMSVGAWGLVAYTGAAGANVVRELAESNVLPRPLRYLAPDVLTPVQAALGAFIMGYTGVLLSATANPFWGSGKKHIPAACVASGTAGACALAGLMSLFENNHHVGHKLERLEMFAGATELLILMDFKRHSGAYGKPMFTGKRGEKLRKFTIFGGIVAPMALNLLGQVVKLPKPLETARVLTSSVLTLIGGYVFRESLIEAGKDSAHDPHAAFRQPK